MCDTFVVMGTYTVDGSVIFGKNSDRDCNEPQVLIRQPRMVHDLAKTPNVKATYIEVPQVEETYEVVLSKPDWMFGAEMAFNEHGLVIGNEAVFTKEKLGPKALTGMDMLRLAAERCKTADEALECIVSLLETYGQGGNCGYQSALEYHNGFLIVDPSKAWVLETAGVYWAAKEVHDFAVISNGLSLGSEFDRCHPELIENALRKRYCSSAEEFDFAKAYAEPLHGKVTKYQQRRCLASEYIQLHKGSFTEHSARVVLRLHTAKQDGKEFTSGSMGSICMHAGGLFGSQSTSSMIAHLKNDTHDYYLTACSTPCISLFKPFWMESETPLWSEDNQEAAVEYWRKREIVHRMILSGRIDPIAHRVNLKTYELEIDNLTRARTDKQLTAAEKTVITKKCFALDEEFVTKARASAKPSSGKVTSGGGPLFKHVWKKASRDFLKGKTTPA